MPTNDFDSAETSDLHVISVDRSSEGVIVLFSNQVSVLYHAQFLFDVREQDHNRILPRENDSELPQEQG